MIHLTCDKCDRELEVPDDLAGKKVKCPACGDINVVPGGAASPPVAAVAAGAGGTGGPGGNGGGAGNGGAGTAGAVRPDRAAAAGYPPAEGPEQRVIRVRRAMFRARPTLFLVLLLVLLGGAAGGLYFWQLASAPRPTVAAGLGALAGLALLVLLVWKFLSLGEALEITTKRTIERNGIFSKSTSEVLHRDIRNVQVQQSFRDRLFGVGRVQISSAADDASEINVTDIPRPKRVREIIDLYRPL